MKCWHNVLLCGVTAELEGGIVPFMGTRFGLLEEVGYLLSYSCLLQVVTTFSVSPSPWGTVMATGMPSRYSLGGKVVVVVHNDIVDLPPPRSLGHLYFGV